MFVLSFDADGRCCEDRRRLCVSPFWKCAEERKIGSLPQEGVLRPFGAENIRQTCVDYVHVGHRLRRNAFRASRLGSPEFGPMTFAFPAPRISASLEIGLAINGRGDLFDVFDGEIADSHAASECRKLLRQHDESSSRNSYVTTVSFLICSHAPVRERRQQTLIRGKRSGDWGTRVWRIDSLPLARRSSWRAAVKVANQRVPTWNG
jgi:hypothetical protein